MKTATAPSTIDVDASTDVQELVCLLEARPEFVRVNHATIGAQNLTVISRRAETPEARAWAKSIVVALASKGYLLYMVQDGTSRFLRQDNIASVWQRVKDGEFSISESGVIYSVTPPKLKTKTPKLLVMFSTIHDNIYSPSLLRYFMENFKTIQKFVPPETAILRIADLGGVTGAFYLDTVAEPYNSQNIRHIIRDTAAALGVSHDDIVLYGASKGGTGALFAALSEGWKCLAVDPIVSDEHYVEEHEDSHFTASGVFPETKQEVFRRAVTAANDIGMVANNQGRWAVICSERSPQFPYIKEILIDNLSPNVLFVNSIHPEITDHPHVGVKTVNWSTMLLNMLFYGIRLETGVKTGI